MVRLPIVGSDDGVWGDELNEFLRVSFNEDGTLKSAGSQAANYALIRIDGGPGVSGQPPLSAANPVFTYPPEALSIMEQSGDDFSIGVDVNDGGGVVLSAAGGLMQCGFIVNPGFASATLDAGNTDPRWVQLGTVCGGNNSPVNRLGYDCTFEVGGNIFGNQTFAGLPGVVLPGGPAVNKVIFIFENPFGTDSVTCDFWDAEALVVWTIGALP